MTDMATEAVDRVRSLVKDAKAGLPEEVFLLVSQLTPLINVDLLIKSTDGKTLLTWREDKYYGPAWHIPGGIIRFKESIESRIVKVARSELGCQVAALGQPIEVRSLMNPSRDIRGHFISLTFLCSLITAPDPDRAFTQGSPRNGQWAWHQGAPHALLKQHEPYRKLIDDHPPLNS